MLCTVIVDLGRLEELVFKEDPLVAVTVTYVFSVVVMVTSVVQSLVEAALT